MNKLTIRKSAPGRYVARLNGEKVGTLQFTRKYRPAPGLPVGWTATIRVKGKRGAIRQVSRYVRNVTEGKKAFALETRNRN